MFKGVYTTIVSTICQNLFIEDDGMLFRPVYGPELEAIFTFISGSAEPVLREDIYRACLPQTDRRTSVSTQGVDDALSFLTAAYLIEGSRKFKSLPVNSDEPFQLLVLRQLQALAQGDLEPVHETDPLYIQLLDQMYIRPDQVFISDLHTAANQVRTVKEIGGLSQEKLRAWKRVMAFLGLGYRVGNGFHCTLSPTLLQSIVERRLLGEMAITAFIETALSRYLPSQTQVGELAQSIQQPFLHLVTCGELIVYTRQDSASRPISVRNSGAM
jgi:hypothetical protein